MVGSEGLEADAVALEGYRNRIDHRRGNYPLIQQGGTRLVRGVNVSCNIGGDFGRVRMMRKLLLLTATISLIAFAPVGAQTATPGSASGPRTGKAQILGVVLDSLNGGFLSGASILIDGLAASAETDSLGRFSFDSLPPGNFQLGVFHPRLDTLSLSIVTRPFHVGPDSTSAVIIGVPSAATIIRDRCPAPTAGAAGMSALIGQVKDPETLQPVARAEVSIAWTEVEISKEVGIRRTPHLLRDTTDKGGVFRLCGLPNSLEGALQARRGAASTAEIPVSLGDRPIELVARSIL